MIAEKAVTLFCLYVVVFGGVWKWWIVGMVKLL